MPAAPNFRVTPIWMRTIIAMVVSATLVALAAVPAARAASPEISSPQAISAVPAGELEKVLTEGELNTLLAGLPVSDLNSTQLVKALASIPGLSSLDSVKGLGGAAGLEKALSESISGLGPNATLGELTSPTKLGGALQSKLTGLLKGLLGGLLGKNPTSTVPETLESLNLGELTSSLISNAKTPEELAGLGTLLDELFGKLSSSKVEELLDATVSEPVTFTPETIEEVAGTLQVTPLTLAESLGKSAQELPETALTLTTPLAEGKLLSVLSSVRGLPMGLLGDVVQSIEETIQGKESSGEETGGEEPSKETTGEETNETPTKEEATEPENNSKEENKAPAEESSKEEETGGVEDPIITQPNFCSEGSGSTVDLEDIMCTEEANHLLSGFPVGDLDRTQLVEALAKLPGLGTLIQLHGVGGVSGLEKALNESIAQLGPTATLGELTDPTKLPEALQSKLTGLLKGLLGGLLGKNPTNVAPETLESLNLGELTSSLLSTATTHQQLADISTLLNELFAKLNTTKLSETLGVPITEPVEFAPRSVEELATTLTTNPLALVQSIGESVQELPATALTLTAPLGEGKLLSVLNSIHGLPMKVLGNLTKSQEEPTQKEEKIEEPKKEEAKKETTGKAPAKEETIQPESKESESNKEDPEIIQVGSGGSGGSGGSSGTSGVPPAQNETINVVLPGTQNVFDTGKAASIAAAVKKSIKIVSHKVKDSRATIVVHVPSGGKVTITGAHLTKTTRKANKAERLTLKIKLTRAGTASLKRHRNLLRITLKATFKPTRGSNSSATTSLRFT